MKGVELSRFSYGLPIVLAFRHAARRPFFSGLFILGVALGVAMIVAIDLANRSATRAFALSTESIFGKSTHQIVGGPGGLDERVYTTLRRTLGLSGCAPIVEGFGTVDELGGQPMRLLGVDSFVESEFRNYADGQSRGPAQNSVLSSLMTRPNTVLISASIAERYAKTSGDILQFRIGGRLKRMEIVAVWHVTDPQRKRTLEGMLIADIATAQEVLEQVGRLSRIDLIIPEGKKGASTLERIAGLLPPGARIQRPYAQTQTKEQMTEAFRLNLTALSTLALVVGMFLIYNTASFSVVQQRTTLGNLRALGMTRREIFTLILIEAGMLGIVGTAIGLGFGILLGRGTVQLVTQSINDLFFVVTVREIELSALILVKGTIIGIGTAVLSALIPAYQATQIPPVATLLRSQLEEQTHTMLPKLSVVGVCTLLVGAVLLIPQWHLLLTFTGVIAILIGVAALTPVFTLGLMRLIRSPLSRQGALGQLAPLDITRSLSRTAIAIAALMVAISVIVGLSLMIGSLRGTVAQWLADLLQADIYVSSPSLANSVASPLEPHVVEKLGTFEGIEKVATARFIEVNAAEKGPIQLTAVSDDIAGEKRHYKAAVGNHIETWQALEAGGLIINESMANRFKLQVDDDVTLLTDQGESGFPVVGVWRDFDARPGALIASLIYRKYWDDTAISSVALFLTPDINVDAKVTELQAAFAGETELIIASNRARRENALAIFDRTFNITVALQALATIVAFIGGLSALMSLQLERRREIGTLRAIGMTRRQLFGLILLETGLMGGVAGLIAMPTGWVLGAILTYIINLRSYGWAVRMQLELAPFVEAFIVALVAALLAGIYPAWRMGRIQPADALRQE